MSRHRQSTTPMDFEWENKTGAIDQNSPFITNVNAQKKRPHSVLDSPSKNGFATSHLPQLRDPSNSQHYLFSQPPSAVPQHVQNSNAWEPRTPASNFDFSSGGETPNTPGVDDSDATPETGLNRKMGRMTTGSRSSSPKKRNSLFKFFGGSSSPSPSKEKAKDKALYSHKGEHRVQKRRSKTKGVSRRDEYESEDENTSLRQGKSRSQQDPQNVFPNAAQAGMGSTLASLFHWIEGHPNLPSVLSWYLQLLFNAFLVFAAIYVVYAFCSAVSGEIELESRRAMADVMREIAGCARDYTDNNCASSRRPPALNNVCDNWQQCMERDAKKVAQASVTAKTIAQIFNSFVEEFSYKSMIFSTIVIFGGFNLSNWAFGLFRSKHQAQQPESFNYPPPPATPQRYPSSGYIDQQGFYTPYTGVNPAMIANASKSLPALPQESEAGAENRSPSKKLTFR